VQSANMVVVAMGFGNLVCMGLVTDSLLVG
jgi:hypothetical protein